jgi:hypothetical protein
MPLYRIYRLKDSQRESFRWAPHTSGISSVKQKDYTQHGAVEADTPYAAWFQLQESGTPLKVGDLLESPEGNLRICKYVGFEEATWFVPESLEQQAPAG